MMMKTDMDTWKQKETKAPLCLETFEDASYCGNKPTWSIWTMNTDTMLVVYLLLCCFAALLLDYSDDEPDITIWNRTVFLSR
jgi:hypothetical protein